MTETSRPLHRHKTFKSKEYVAPQTHFTDENYLEIMQLKISKYKNLNYGSINTLQNMDFKVQILNGKMFK